MAKLADWAVRARARILHRFSRHGLAKAFQWVGFGQPFVRGLESGATPGQIRYCRRMECLFCQIAEGSARAHIVEDGGDVVAFLDAAPIRPGHVLIVPRQHIHYFEDLPTELADGITRLAQRIARAQKAAFGVDRVAFLYTGGDISHVHAHLVPMHEKTDVTSRRYIAERDVTFRPMPDADDGQLVEAARVLREAMAR